MTSRTLLMVGMLLMACSVALGAFGAHALKATLEATGRTETFELAIRYMTVHSLALILFGLLMDKYPGLLKAAALLFMGIVFFSGSLLVLALADQPLWGAVAPLGGTALILGWLTACWTVFQSKS